LVAGGGGGRPKEKGKEIVRSWPRRALAGRREGASSVGETQGLTGAGRTALPSYEENSMVDPRRKQRLPPRPARVGISLPRGGKVDPSYKWADAGEWEEGSISLANRTGEAGARKKKHSLNSAGLRRREQKN